MTYQGYTGAIEVDEDSGTLFGTVLGTRDTVTFVGTTIEEARQSLADSVDFYLERCAATGKEPDRPFSGELRTRITPEAHRQLAELAHGWRVSVNDVVAEALDRFIAANRSAEYRPPIHVPKPKPKPKPKRSRSSDASHPAPRRRKTSEAV